MAKNDNQRSSTQGKSASHLLPHVRYNSQTGSNDYFYPLELENETDEEFARLRGYQVGWTWRGQKKIRAAMVPCRQKAYDEHGNEIFLDTKEDEQHRIYKALMGDENAAQDRAKHDGLCSFIKENGQRKRCPYRIPNPNFNPAIPHNPKTNPKTIRNHCECCRYYSFKEAHDVVTFTDLEMHNERGETISFEPLSPWNHDEADRYKELANAVRAVIRQYKPKLGSLVDLLANELTQAEAANLLGKKPTTINSQRKLLRHLLDTVPELQALLLNN